MRLPVMLFGLAMGLWACGSSSETAATASASGTNPSSAASSGAGGQGGASSSGASIPSGQGGSAGQGGSVGAAQCMTICDTQAQLVCPGFEHAACVADCESLAEVAPWCMTTTDAFNACLAAQPTNSFVCDPETAGDVDAKPGVCSADVDAVRDCWFEGPSGGLPDLSAAVASICTEQTSLPCAHASCVSDYMALQLDRVI